MTDDANAGPPPDRLPRELRRGGEPAAWRLVFRYGPDGVSLAACTRVAMIAPPDDSALTAGGRAGSWVELRDADGKGLYRQVIADPLATGREAHHEDPEVASYHVSAAEPRSGAFSVVVPDLPAAQDVVLLRLPGSEQSEPGARAASRTGEPVLTEALHETPPFSVT